MRIAPPQNQDPETHEDEREQRADVGEVHHLRLARPEQLNAINDELHAALTELFPQLSADADARAAVITGSGRAFSAGGDLDVMRAVVGTDADGYVAQVRAARDRQARRDRRLFRRSARQRDHARDGGPGLVVHGLACEAHVVDDDPERWRVEAFHARVARAPVGGVARSSRAFISPSLVGARPVEAVNV